MTFGPLTRISPSGAILTGTPGMTLPTVPNRRSSNVLTAITGAVSVRP